MKIPIASLRRVGSAGVAARVLAWHVAWLAGGAGAALAVDEVEFIRVTNGDSSAEVRILSSGRPGVIGSQLDQDGFLVIELADHRPATGLEVSPQATGLVAGVEVALHRDDGGVATRILVRTRGRATHAISLEGPLVQVALRRAAVEAASPPAETSRLEERIQTTSEALAESEQSRAVLLGQIETMSKANRQLVQLFEELQTRRGQLEDGLETARRELTRLREERAARDEESSRRLAEVTAREEELNELVERLGGELVEADSARAELAGRLADTVAEQRALEARSVDLETQANELAASLQQAEAEVERYRAAGLVRGRATANVNLRAGPGTEHAVLGSLPAETVAEVLGRGDDWLQVRVGDRRGWVSAEYFALEEDELSATRARMAELEAELGRNREEVGLWEERLVRAEAEQRELGRQREALAAELEVARGDIDRLTAVGEERAGELSEALEAAAALESELERRVGEMSARYDASQQSKSQLQRRLEQAAGKRDELADELSEALQRATELEAELSRTRQESGSLQGRLTAVDVERQELAGEREALAAELEVARGDIARLTAAGAERTGELSERLEAATAREAELERRLSELSAQYGASRDSESELTRRLQQVVGEQATMADRLLEAAAREEDLVRRVETLTADVAEAREAEQGLTRQLAEADEARAELERRLTNAAERDGALQRRVAELGARLEAAQSVEADLRGALEDSGADRSDLEARLDEVTRARAALAAEVEVLGEQRERLTAELTAARQEAERYREQGLLRGRATANVNLRAGPGLQFERFGLLPAETVAEVLRRGDGWIQVRAEGRPGWVSADYFKLEEDELSALGSRLAELDGELGRSQAQSEELADRLQRVTAERDSLAEEVQATRQALARADAESGARLAELAAGLEAAQDRESEMTRRVQELEAEVAAAREAETELTAGLAEADAARTELAQRLAELEAEKAVLEDQASALAAAKQELGSELEQALGTVQGYREQGLVRAHTTAGVNLRSGPGVDFEPIAVLPVETVVEVLNRGEGWLRVRAGGLEGWIAADYMRLENDELSALRGTVAELTAMVTGMERSGQDLERQLEDAAVERAGLEARLGEAREQESLLLTRVGELDRKLAAAAAEKRSAESSRARLGEEKSRLEARLEAVAGERAELGRRVESLEAERVELEARAAGLSDELETTRGALDRLAAAPEPAPAAAAETAPASGPRAAVEAWAAAWSNRNVDRYLSYYARDFQPPDGATRSQWEALRRARLSRPNQIRVELSDLRVIDLAPGRATVTFTQSYESDLYRDRVGKLLELVSEGGRWKIARELVR